ncbi:hypothetical protein D3C76_191440 [compost metagenome]
MYIKNNKIKLANNIDEIPANDIEIADQIMIIENIFKPNTWRYNDPEEIEGVVSMALVSITHENIYCFECVQMYSDYKIEDKYGDNDEYEEIMVSKGMEVKKFTRTYFKTNKNKLMILVDDENWDMPLFSDEIDVDSINSNLLRQIHENIFSEKDNKIYQKAFLKQDENKYNVMHYFKLKINEDKYIVFTIKNIFDFKKRYWSISKNIRLFERENRTVYTLEVDYDKTVTNFKENYSNVNFENLDRMNQVSEYEIKDYLNEDKTEQKRESELFELYYYFHEKDNDYPTLYHKICKLFDPIFINTDMNLKIYPDELKYGRIYCGNMIVKDNKKLNIPYANDKEDESLSNQIRIANAISNFYYNNDENGINPKDGLVYSNGIINYEAMNINKYHKDADMVFYNYDSYNFTSRYNINIDGYYIQANNNNEKDKEAIQDYQDRLKIMNTLSEC